jgi:hypothetical protein
MCLPVVCIFVCDALEIHMPNEARLLTMESIENLCKDRLVQS